VIALGFIDSWTLIVSTIALVLCVAWLVHQALDAGAEYLSAWKAGSEGPAEPSREKAASGS
jgi:hypothetical protein